MGKTKINKSDIENETTYLRVLLDTLEAELKKEKSDEQFINERLTRMERSIKCIRRVI